MRHAPIVAALLVLASAPLRAQTSSTDRLVPGAWSLSFALPGGGGTSVGLWTMVSRRLNLGVNVGYAYRHGTSERSDSISGTSRGEEGDWLLRVEPTVHLYGRLRPNVAPFLLGQVGASYQWSGTNGAYGWQRSRSWSLYTRLGLGLEWFPVSSVSVDGWVAVSLATSFRHGSDGYSTNDGSTREVGTMTSALSLRIYP